MTGYGTGRAKDGAHEAFARRLNEALALHPASPARRHGRLSWLRDALAELGVEVSLNAVSRWAGGNALPRHATATAIAQALRVDAAWLLHGSARTDGDPARTALRAGAQRATSATLALAGFVELAGGRAALPGPGDGAADIPDDTGGVDLHVVASRRHWTAAVAVGTIGPDGVVTFELGGTVRADRLVGVLAAPSEGTLRLLDLSSAARAPSSGAGTRIELRRDAHGRLLDGEGQRVDALRLDDATGDRSAGQGA